MSNIKPTIGVLALQGAVDLHQPHIEGVGANFKAVKTKQDFEAVDAFILPGGESTTMLKLIDVFDLWDTLSEQFSQKPVWGICAGAILLAETVYRQNGEKQQSFNRLPIEIERNGYGRQLESHKTDVNGYTVSFIRAPIIKDAGDCDVLHVHEDNPAWVRKGQVMATAFHPEVNLESPSPIHQYFMEELVRPAKSS